MGWEFDEKAHDYKLIKGEKSDTLAHSGDKAKHIMHVHYKDTHIGDISPESDYHETRRKRARIVSTRKNVTRWAVNLKPEHNVYGREGIPFREARGHTSPKVALKTMFQYHKTDKE
jgi:hypothetical protein